MTLAEACERRFVIAATLISLAKPSMVIFENTLNILFEFQLRKQKFSSTNFFFNPKTSIFSCTSQRFTYKIVS